MAARAAAAEQAARWCRGRSLGETASLLIGLAAARRSHPSLMTPTPMVEAMALLAADWAFRPSWMRPTTNAMRCWQAPAGSRTE